MPGRVVFFVQNGGYEPAFAAASLGATAAAMGDEVTLVFAFDALRQLARGTFGTPITEREISESARAKGIHAATPAKLLEEARKLGARLVACDTTVKLCGFSPDDLALTLDEVMGLPALWRITDGARVLTF